MKEEGNWAPVLSAIWPGLGHVYAGSRFGPIVMLLYAGLAAWFFLAVRRFGASVESWLTPLILMAFVWLLCVYSTFPGEEAEEPEPVSDEEIEAELAANKEGE